MVCYNLKKQDAELCKAEFQLCKIVAGKDNTIESHWNIVRGFLWAAKSKVLVFFFKDFYIF